MFFGALALFATPSQAQTSPCIGAYWFCDDFNGAVLDPARWTAGNLDIASQYPVRPANIVRTTVNDNDNTITVIDASIYGDLHSGPKRQGGVIITRAQYGGGRYEVRMKNAAGPTGCSCMWNYYDSLNETNPPPVRQYTEIDIEMPAHLASPPAWAMWKKRIGLNTWADSDDDAHATYLSPAVSMNPFDGQFHVYRWDWRDGSNGARKIDWYIDNTLIGSTTQHVGAHAAQLWIGVWPAPWSGMTWNFDTQHVYIDWVRMSALP
ncbi:MAG: glycoside hydrolase family 16 protein [Asticcacaulis sp.]